MKVKMKLDMAGIKRLALEHGEKAAFAIVLIVFVGFVYGGARREVLDSTKQPDRLKSLAAEVKAHVQNSTWASSPDKDKTQVVNYIDRTTRETVAAANYALRTPFNPRIFDEKGTREDPQLFNAEELHVGSGFGTFAMRGAEPAAGARPEPGRAAPPNRAAPAGDAAGPVGARANFGPAASGKRPTGHGVKPSRNAVLKTQAWVVVTGLVPVEKQAKEYARAFEHAMAYDARRDKPNYIGYQLERAEISSSEPDKLDWKPVRNRKVEDNFESFADEVVEGEYVLEDLTSPLGPLVNKDWTESVAHPKVPLAWAKPSQVTTGAAEADKDKDAVKEDATDKPAEAADDGIVVGRTRKPQQPVASPTAPGIDAPPPIAFRLLRVFDYSVETGKRYRYRIKLALVNPNHGIAPKNLKNSDKRPDTVRGERVLTPQWSEPTDIVTVPNGSGVLAGGIKPPKSGDQIRAKLILTAIDPDKGIEASVEKEFERGAVANAVESDVKARDPVTESITEIPKVRFQSNMVVLDIYGGKTLGKRGSTLTTPAEVLMLDGSGNLTVHGELDDLAAYESAKPPEEPEARAADKDKPPGGDPKRKPQPR